jgi:hypothetical protein
VESVNTDGENEALFEVGKTVPEVDGRVRELFEGNGRTMLSSPEDVILENIEDVPKTSV